MPRVCPPPPAPMPTLHSAFFIVCNSKHFVALASLVSSLREVGHTDPVYVTDCGLTGRQRETIRSHVELIEAPLTMPPELLKMYGPLTVRPKIAVVLDADLIFRRSIGDLLTGRTVMFVDAQPDRHHPDWTKLGFAQTHDHPYFNSGTLILTNGLPALIQEAIDRMIKVASSDSSVHRTADDPFHWADQDAINALFGTIDPASYDVSDDVAYWPFRAGTDTARIWHHILPKPWLVPRPQTAFTREMVRLLAEGHVDVPLDLVPRRFRRGLAGDVARAWFTARYELSSRTRGKLGIRAKLGYRPGSRHFSAGVSTSIDGDDPLPRDRRPRSAPDSTAGGPAADDLVRRCERRCLIASLRVRAGRCTRSGPSSIPAVGPRGMPAKGPRKRSSTRGAPLRETVADGPFAGMKLPPALIRWGRPRHTS